MHKLAVLASAFVLCACSSPPEPPTVSGNNRQSVNANQTTAHSELSAALAEQAKAKTSPEPVALSAALADQAKAKTSPAPSVTFSAFFPFNGTKLSIPESEIARMKPLLAKAKRVEVRGRTDGKHPHAGDEKIALNRALAAQRFLIGQGVSPAKISVNYVSAGDYVADNFSAAGRKKNRRVDIEIFN